MVVALPACAGISLPTGSTAGPPAQTPIPTPTPIPPNTVSILKLLTKEVTIGSTVDRVNGDKGPRAISIVPCNCNGAFSQGQLVVCNFENSAGIAGSGSTIEILDPEPRSPLIRFAQSDSIEGCDGTTLTSINGLYGAGITSERVVQYSNSGIVKRVYSGKTIAAPFSDVDAFPLPSFSPEYIFVGTTSGGIVNISAGFDGNGVATQVAQGFAVNADTGWRALAPSGLQYDRQLDTLYVVDGVTDTIVAFNHASELLEENEIVVESGGKTFECEHPRLTCGRLVYSGKPLDAPIASTLLPNGNLIVANTRGKANTLVELTPQGKILDTKVVDASTAAGVYGLAAAGTNDSNTVLFFTDANFNTVQKLEQ